MHTSLGLWTQRRSLQIAGGPQLSRLSVTDLHFTLPLEGTGFAALKFLTFTRLEAPTEYFLATLGACPRLEHLTLDGCYWPISVETDDIAVLPGLKVLNLLRSFPSDIITIVGRIRADGLTTLNATVSPGQFDPDDTPAEELLRYIVGPDSLWNTALRNQAINTVHMEVGGDDYNEEFSQMILSGPGTVSLYSDTDWCDTFVEWAKEDLVQSFGTAVHLNLGMHGCWFHQRKFLNAIGHIPRLISLNCDVRIAQDLMMLLAEPQSSAAGSPSLCADLERITLFASGCGDRDHGQNTFEMDELIPSIIGLLSVRGEGAVALVAQSENNELGSSEEGSRPQPITIWDSVGRVFDESEGMFV